MIPSRGADALYYRLAGVLRSQIEQGDVRPLICRMPTTPERIAMDIESGTPLLQIVRADGQIEVLAADQVEIVVVGSPSSPGHSVAATRSTAGRRAIHSADGGPP